jgi:hypothetical protein
VDELKIDHRTTGAGAAEDFSGVATTEQHQHERELLALVMIWRLQE